MPENLNLERGANALYHFKASSSWQHFGISEEWHIKLTSLDAGPDETKWLIKKLIKNCPND